MRAPLPLRRLDSTPIAAGVRFTGMLQPAFCPGGALRGSRSPMRATYLALGLLLLVPLAFVPTASAGEWCWMTEDGTGVCCAAPDPVGPPGSPQYFVTNTVEDGVFTTCYNVVLAYVVADYAVDCLVAHQC